MKKIIMTIMFAATATMVLEAQSYRNYNPNEYRSYNYRSSSVNNFNRYNVTYDYRYLPRNVRKRLSALEYKLVDTKRCALRDGRISRREARRIGRIQNDIDALLFDYRARTNYRSNRRIICR